jgi:hypothetical protein
MKTSLWLAAWRERLHRWLAPPGQWDPTAHRGWYQ